jgi:hypothetical protein
MGTRSTTKIKDIRGVVLATCYKQYDGYPTSYGQELADFLKGIRVTNGIAGEGTANGMGCLTAQLIAHFKSQYPVGGFYMTSPSDKQEYNYTVYMVGETLYMRCESEYYGLLFNGTPIEFNGKQVQALQNKKAEDDD